MCAQGYGVSEANGRGIELNTRRKISHIQATMYYFVYNINIILARRSRLKENALPFIRMYHFIFQPKFPGIPCKW